MIATHTIAGDSHGPHLLITAGVHGDEFEPMAAVRRLIQSIDSRGLRGRVTLAPVVNMAAFARAHRMAEDGLDLARTCPGDPQGSVTQRTAHALSQLIRDANLYIDLHTGGAAMSVLPLSGYVLHHDHQVLDTQRRMARAFNLPIIWGTSAELEGRSLSVARDARVPAIYAEYHGPGPCEPAAIEAYEAGCLDVMAAMGMIDRPRPASRVQQIVEDPRSGSGHMQQNNPAPAEGFFEPAVSLGDWVRGGDPLGVLVLDPLGNERLTISARESGMVLVLRTVPSVRKGDSLAVILETQHG